MHILCTICSDLVNQAENIYVTKCGHIFHYHCLTQWIERSQTCPQCRNKITAKCIHRLYPTISNVGSDDDAAILQSRLDNAQLLLRQQAVECKGKDEKISAITTELKKKEENLKDAEKQFVSCQSNLYAVKKQLDYLKVQNKEVQKMKEEIVALKKKLQTLTDLETVLNATSEEADILLLNNVSETTGIYASALKRALTDSQSQKNELRDQLHLVKQELAAEKSKHNDLHVKYMKVQELLSKHERRKRKVCEELDASILNDTWKSKVQRLSDPHPLNQSYVCDSDDDELITNLSINQSNTSVTTLVNKIENADSPYLNLKQSSVALSTLQRSTLYKAGNKFTATETLWKDRLTTVAPNKLTTENVPSNNQRNNSSIFSRKEPPKYDMSENKDSSKYDTSVPYDGLAGHSKLSNFLFSNKTDSWNSKNIARKLTAKHRLKNPNTTSNKNVLKLFAQAREK